MAHRRVAERFETDVANLGFVEGDEWDWMLNKLTSWARQGGFQNLGALNDANDIQTLSADIAEIKKLLLKKD